MHQEAIDFIRSIYGDADVIGLHEPRFWGNEKSYLNDSIDSTFVSSVGKYVEQFEKNICEYSGAKYAVAVVNGTNALQVALGVGGVKRDDIVITQALSFVATCNAISYLGAIPLFVDVDKHTMGLSPDSLRDFLKNETVQKEDGFTYHKELGNRISACVPMHSFGFICRIGDIVSLCAEYNITVVEDAAEAVGSTMNGKRAGTYGKCGIYSFNGNKIITSGGGGMVLTDDSVLAEQVKHLTTVAKIPHAWKFEHDEIGYNFRMPNINAALACAQLEQLDHFLEAKRALSMEYQEFFSGFEDVTYVNEPEGVVSNYWLNSILFNETAEKEAFLTFTNERGIMTRPVWELLSALRMYKTCPSYGLDNSKWISERLVSLPSTVPNKSKN
jgi:aminotransferase in exopolysaccharide biosynthesis